MCSSKKLLILNILVLCRTPVLFFFLVIEREMSQEAKLSKSNQAKNVWAASLSNVMSGYNLNIINVVVVILGELYVCSIPCVEILFMPI